MKLFVLVAILFLCFSQSGYAQSVVCYGNETLGDCEDQLDPPDSPCTQNYCNLVKQYDENNNPVIVNGKWLVEASCPADTFESVSTGAVVLICTDAGGDAYASSLSEEDEVVCYERRPCPLACLELSEIHTTGNVGGVEYIIYKHSCTSVTTPVSAYEGGASVPSEPCKGDQLCNPVVDDPISGPGGA